MIHDVWGLADHTRDLARRLAQEEFSVLAIDLYRREEEVKTRPSSRAVLVSADRDARWREVQWTLQACADPAVRITVAVLVDFGGAQK